MLVLTCLMKISIRQLRKLLSSRLQDKKRKEGVELRNDADSMIFQTEKALDEVGDKLDAADKGCS